MQKKTVAEHKAELRKHKIEKSKKDSWGELADSWPTMASRQHRIMAFAPYTKRTASFI